MYKRKSGRQSRGFPILPCSAPPLCLASVMSCSMYRNQKIYLKCRGSSRGRRWRRRTLPGGWHGPCFNRMTRKTAINERTGGGTTHQLDPPFLEISISPYPKSHLCPFPGVDPQKANRSLGPPPHALPFGGGGSPHTLLTSAALVPEGTAEIRIRARLLQVISSRMDNEVGRHHQPNSILPKIEVVRSHPQISNLHPL